MSDGDRDEGEQPSAASSVAGVAGGVGGTLEGIAEGLGEGEDTHAAREGLETAAHVAESAEEGAETAGEVQEAIEAFRDGDHAGGVSHVGGALGHAGAGTGALAGGIADALPAGEAREGFRAASRVASAVGQVARGVGQIVDGVSEIVDRIAHPREPVEIHLELEGEDVHWKVETADVSERVDALSIATVQASTEGHLTSTERQLLMKNASIAIERGTQRRHFRGIVRHAHVRQRDEVTVVQLEIVPALWLATETLDSRVYQDKSVPDLVETLVREVLGSRAPNVRRELSETYSPHEYLVQHRESYFELIARLLREEGIWFYFDHDAEGQTHEVLVLVDGNENRPVVRPDHRGVVEYDEREAVRDGREVAFHVSRAHRVGATDTVVRGFDWTNPPLEVHHEARERAEWSGPRMEIYDHHHAVRHHDYDEEGGSYRDHTAEKRSRMHTERLDLARSTWMIATTVVTADPGKVLDLHGTDHDDGRYLILGADAHYSRGGHGDYRNTLRVIPADMPYRPAAPARRTMPGPETATVVGPKGDEIHTDKHGRVKVQFHWDRHGGKDDKASAWIRVAQSWAGPGFGTIFIPRIGMEVIVSFLGGDPDRPMITGCVYNGHNHTPYELPKYKTRSTIKTKSGSPDIVVGAGGRRRDAHPPPASRFRLLRPGPRGTRDAQLEDAPAGARSRARGGGERAVGGHGGRQPCSSGGGASDEE
jgi:type VI secretion system secreted protein VgrG